ncbi:MAG: hypothetical protein JW864_11220 [Spirochaetes bacterium]|nr:hypothetical protein [Spirochaetota bacterium]
MTLLEKTFSLAAARKTGLLILIFILTIMACSDEQVREDKLQDKPAPEFRDEGFITDNLFRIIIVKPKDSSYDTAISEKYAKKRALISLRKHVQSRKGKIDRNMNAALLNLIERNGELRKEKSNKDRDIYLFEIKKNNLKDYLNRI